MRLALYAKVYVVQFKNNFVREAVYRSNFLTSLIVDLVWFLLEASLFTVIYEHTPTLGGWTVHQVYFFLGLFFASDALFTIFFSRNFWTFSDLVNKGELDILLTKPIHPLFMALTRWMSLTAFFNFLMGIVIMFKFGERAGFDGGWKWSLVLGWFAVGLATQTLMRFAFSIWIFWTERGFALARLYYTFFTIGTKPDVIYPAMIRYTILTFFPFAFIGSVPARALTQGLQGWEYFWVAFVLVIFFLVNKALWRRGLRRYQSASS